MRLLPTSEQEMMRESAVKLLLRHTGDARTYVDPKTVWNDLADAGWLALAVPESRGGLGFGSDGVGIFMRELGRAAASVPFVECAIIAADLIAGLADEGKAESLLQDLTAGKTIILPAINEQLPRGFDIVNTTTAVRDGGMWTIHGSKQLIKHGQTADFFLVLAHDGSGEPALLLIPSDAEGLSTTTYKTVDHAYAVDLELNGVVVADDMVIRTPDLTSVLQQAIRRATCALCSDAVGAMERLAHLTSTYVQERQQFGRKLAANQAVEHKIAQMAVAVEEASGAALLASLCVDGDPQRSADMVHSAKAKIGRASRYVAQNAVQLHGGMGVSEELSVHRYFRRLLAFEQTFGTTDSHLEAVAERLRQEPASPSVIDRAAAIDQTGAQHMDLALSEEDIRFRSDVAAFLDEKLSPELRRAQRLNHSFFSEPGVNKAWHRELFKQGWVAPYLPKTCGGTGWTPTEAYIFANEVAKAGAPLLQGQGLRMVAPVLVKYGTESQKERFLPGILSGEDYWCQGFSEPQAGSDLAALSTRAVRDGDDYVINGTKIWTSHAHHADKIFCLVRTADGAKRQDGISFVVFDMNLPGITVQPIMTMDGHHEVNQVFFDNVRIPVANRIGEENRGWEIAKYLLEFERGSVTGPYMRSILNKALKVAEAKKDGNRNSLAWSSIRTRLAQISTDLDAFEMVELGLVATLQAGKNPGVASSIAKLRNSEIRQALSETIVDILGPEALRFNEAHPLSALPIEDPVDQTRAIATPKYLQERVLTIFGGASEVQLTIIGRAALSKAA